MPKIDRIVGVKRSFEELSADISIDCSLPQHSEPMGLALREGALGPDDLNEIDSLLQALSAEEPFITNSASDGFRSFSAMELSPDLFEDELDLTDTCYSDLSAGEDTLPAAVNSPESPRWTSASPPKGYVSAFNFFVMHQRPKIVADNPALRCSNNTLNKILGEMWKVLPEHERHEYKMQANADKQRYLQELSIYNETANEKIIPRINPPPGCNTNGDASMNLEGTTDVKSVKRPLTAYSIFAQQEKQFVLGLECTELQRRMGRYFGIRWKNMDA